MQLAKQRTGVYQSATTSPRTEPWHDPETEPAVRHRLAVRAGARERRSRAHRSAVRAVHRRGVRRAAKRQYFDTINPASEKKLARVARADAADVDRAVAAARRAWQRTWSKMPPAERGKYLYRIARALQERAREFAVIESLDGGKPIRESRDVDVPLAAAHFFYYAGWADKLDYAFPGRKPAPARRGRPDHPVELPAADGGVEDRAGARLRQHGGAQTRRDDAAHRAQARRADPRRRRCPPAS